MLTYTLYVGPEENAIILQKFPFLTGVPLSEIKSKQSMQIKVLNGEEIEKMRVACRVRDLLSLFCCLLLNVFSFFCLPSNLHA